MPVPDFLLIVMKGYKENKDVSETIIAQEEDRQIDDSVTQCLLRPLFKLLVSQTAVRGYLLFNIF